ncbi:BTAD domain-containing putative transcriptional regulator [Streptomyces sp. NPDC014734]|uniref:AfsR/SARP family transcriptional regulator n=1 Tax=Streptomyces sp. NPDC014734 TaxID=3364886 RepID=UPI0036FDD24F
MFVGCTPAFASAGFQSLRSTLFPYGTRRASRGNSRKEESGGYMSSGTGQPQLQFKILGPLSVTAQGRPVSIGGSRQRTILAMLLLRPGNVVSVDVLVEAVWNGRPPATARTQVAICIAALRKRFKVEGCDDEVILTAHPGYVLALDHHYLDATDFDRLVADAQEAVRQQRPVDAATLYEEALDLWQGPALAGVAGTQVEDEIQRLEELRLATYDSFVEVQLELGHHRDIIPGLVSVVRDHPLRERSRHALMLAQYRVGRRAEAMETFREGWEESVEGLGLEPGPELQELHTAILQDDPGLITPATTAPRPATTERRMPMELPADVPDFVGRVPQLAALGGLVGNDEAAHTPLSVGLITGPAGAGKSGLAIHWAHRVAERFPDGLLFADLGPQQEHQEPPTADAVLGRFLSSLGVPATEIPAATAERVALYRSVLAGRRVLIVLDNVQTFNQIHALIPGGSRCCVLVTSRGELEQLLIRHGAVRIGVDALPVHEAVSLLGRVIGEARVDAARSEAVQLVELCDRLPLTIRVAAARLAAKPHWPIGYLVSRLTPEHSRLDELSVAGAQIRSVFSLGYRTLSPDAALLYRRLGLLEAPDFAAWVGAALLDRDLAGTEKLIDQLLTAQLLAAAGFDGTGEPRYRFRTLSRLYAKELGHRHESVQDRRAALSRAFEGWRTLAEHARRAEHDALDPLCRTAPQRGPADAALYSRLVRYPADWLRAERQALISVIDQAARHGMNQISNELAALMLDRPVDCVARARSPQAPAA